MKKNLVAGLFAVGLIVAGGTGYYLAGAKDNVADPAVMMQQHKDTGSMVQMMNSTNIKEDQSQKDDGFKQMLPFMKKMHPNLSDEELKSFYEKMHGDGAPSCGNNGQGMMGNFSKDSQTDL